jgi:two-component system NtrC family sensor kinase
MNWGMPVRTTTLTGVSEGDGEKTAAPEAERATLTARYQEQSRALEVANADLEAALARAGAAEAALSEAKERAERCLDVAGVMLVTVAADGTINVINKKGCEILGYEEKDLVGKNWFDIMVPPAERSDRIKRFRSLLSDRVQSSNGECTVTTRDGAERLIAFKTAALTDGDGKTCGILASGEDITELRKTQERLQHSRTLASLGEMTAGIAHEVNNPLGSILLHSELMLREGLAQEAMQDLRVIHDEAKRAARIMTDLLTYSQQHGTETRRMDLNGIAQEVCGLRGRTHSLKSIQAHLDLAEGGVFVEGDRSQMMKLFLNLIQNAEEAVEEIPTGEIHVTTLIEDGWAKVSVADNGTGIRAEDLKQVFYPFFTTKRTAGGRGLGLSICHGIVTDHQGLIYADNKDAGGATLTVELPLAKGPGRGKR